MRLPHVHKLISTLLDTNADWRPQAISLPTSLLSRLSPADSVLHLHRRSVLSLPRAMHGFPPPTDISAWKQSTGGKLEEF